MRLISRLILSLISNAVGLIAAAYLIPGFSITLTLAGVLTAAGLLTLINLLVRPIVKLILTPFIILTLGLLTIAINGVILYVLDIFLEGLTIEGFAALLWGTILMSAINLVIHTIARSRA